MVESNTQKINITVNRFLTAILTIPPEISLLELRSVLSTVDKIAKASGSLDEPITLRKTRTYNKHNLKFSAEVNDELIKLHKEGKGAGDVADILSKKFTPQQYTRRDVWSQRYVLRKKGVKI